MSTEISREGLEAVTTKLLQRLSEKGVYSEAMNGIDPKHRQELERAVDNHAARQRAAGKKGW